MSDSAVEVIQDDGVEGIPLINFTLIMHALLYSGEISSQDSYSYCFVSAKGKAAEKAADESKDPSAVKVKLCYNCLAPQGCQVGFCKYCGLNFKFVTKFCPYKFVQSFLSKSHS